MNFRPDGMSMHGLWRLAAQLVLLGFVSTGSVHAEEAEAKPKPPNLLMILTDDQSGLCMGAAGDSRGATPNLDALAQQGVFFNRAFCNSPLCTPSRQSLITGLYPHATGVTCLETRLPESALTLGGWLNVLGYRTAAIGKMHFNGPSHHGFELRVDTVDWDARLRRHQPEGGDHRRPWKPFADPAAVWLNARCEDFGLPEDAMEATYFVDRAIRFMKKNRDRPFAMVVSLYEPHAPFRFPREWRGRYRPDEFALRPFSDRDRDEQPKVFHDLTDDDFRGIQAAYYTALSFADSQIGRLVRALDENGLGNDTLVVFLSDNGYLLGQHGRVEKNCLYEPAVRIPLIFRWNGHIPVSRKLLELVELVDVFPTICDLLKVPLPPLLHGKNLAPLIQGKPLATGHEYVFSEYNENEEAMVRSARHKLIVGSGRRQRRDHLETGKPSTGPMLRLYDLDNDPEETNDLSEEPRLADVRARLLAELHRRLTTTRQGLEPVPPNLSQMEAIYWCLTPRDRPVHPPQTH